MAGIELAIVFEVSEAADLNQLRAKARAADDANIGAHAVEYTVEQALTVVWQDDPKWLHDNVLAGWWVADDLAWGPTEDSDDGEEV